MNNDIVRRLVELLRLERNRPPEFADGGRSAAGLASTRCGPSRRSSATTIRTWTQLVGPRAGGKQRCES